MKTTRDGFSIIEKWEQFRAEPYQDSVGVWTIGYGHTRTASREMGSVTKGMAITWLRQDVQFVEMYINHNFHDLRQCQFDALVSLLFNIGTKKFLSTNLAKLLKENPDSKHVADEWIEFRNAGGKYLRGLLRRRLDELSLYYSW